MALIKPFITSFVKANAKSWSALLDLHRGYGYLEYATNKAINCHRLTL